MRKTFKILNYQAKVYTYASGGGAPSNFETLISVRGEVDTVYIHFVTEFSKEKQAVWFLENNFGRIYMKEKLFSIIIDLLRNEEPCYCTISNDGTGHGTISTGLEPIGEEESN